jgi:hypothetical protein
MSYCIPFRRSSFSDFAAKYGKDERFKGIEKMRERENLFADYCSELRRREKEEKANQKEKVNIATVVQTFEICHEPSLGNSHVWVQRFFLDFICQSFQKRVK